MRGGSERQAQCLGSPQINGLLAGVPVGVKDIIDTGDHPTAFYSPIYAHNRPSQDAHVVALLRQAGAVIMGKTHTTEFAYMHTGPTRNPHDLRGRRAAPVPALLRAWPRVFPPCPGHANGGLAA